MDNDYEFIDINYIKQNSYFYNYLVKNSMLFSFANYGDHQETTARGEERSNRMACRNLLSDLDKQFYDDLLKYIEMGLVDIHFSIVYMNHERVYMCGIDIHNMPNDAFADKMDSETYLNEVYENNSFFIYLMVRAEDFEEFMNTMISNEVPFMLTSAPLPGIPK